MTKGISRGVFALAALGCLGACGVDDGEQPIPMVEDSEQVTPICMGAGQDPGCTIAVDEHSFVRAAFPVTDGRSTAVVRHAPGRFCMAGTVDSGPSGLGWGSLLVVSLTDRAQRVPFDASARGIAQIRFHVQDPPQGGLFVEVDQLESAHCEQVHCTTILDRAAPVTDPGIVTVPLADFTVTDDYHPGTVVDPTLITAFNFYVPGVPGQARGYDFCIEGLAFLDAGGREITPGSMQDPG